MLRRSNILRQSIIGACLVFFIHPAVKEYYFGLGLRWQYIFVFSFIACFFLTPLCRALALRLNILDHPDERKNHELPTPLLGGLGVYLAFAGSLLFNSIFPPGMGILLIGASCIFLMGLWDDIRPVPALPRLALQVLIALMVMLWGDIHLTLFPGSSWSFLINGPLTILWLVGLTNAFNFFDGMDGLAAGLSIITAFFLGIIAFNSEQPALGWLSVAIIGACLGFLPYNFRFGKSALLFLGDAGSTFLGFILAGLALLGTWSKTSDFVSLTSPILIFGVFLFDMIYVNLSRIKNRQMKTVLDIITCPGRDHLHHRLLLIGFTRKEVVFVICTISTSLGVSAIIIMNQKLIEALLGLFQAALILGLIVALMLKGREKVPRKGERRIWQRRREDRRLPE